MKQYLELLKAILDNGVKTGDRTGTGTMTLPGYHYQIQLHQDEGIIHNFPLLTTKFISLKSVFEELIWKLRGDTNIRFLIENDNHIWTEWPFKRWLQETNQYDILNQMWRDRRKSDYSDLWKTKKREFENSILTDEDFSRRWGQLGKTYGYQFRHFNGGVDQLKNTIELIKNSPESRRIIISLWNPSDLAETLLPPCPAFYQFFANNKDGYLHLNLYQRSCDAFLGVPYNTAQDALFLCLMAHTTGRKPGRFNHFFGDSHIYLNHIDQVKEQLKRKPAELPSIRLNPDVKNILDFTWEDIELINYKPQAPIKGAVSIGLRTITKFPYPFSEGNFLY